MLITIIIPVYDTASFLRKCLDSLRTQTFEEWEAICIDDGSTDECPEILDEYACRDQRIKVVHRENGGPGVARNAAFPLAHGEWIGFLDSDDFLETDWLQRVAEEIDKRHPDLVRCEFKRLFEEPDGGRIVERGRKNGFALFNSDDVMRWGWGKWLKEAMICLCFYRREMLLSSGIVFEPHCVLEDMIFNMNLLPHINSMSQIGSAGYLYRQRAGSLVHLGLRNFAAHQKVLYAGLNAYEDQRCRLAELELFTVAFRFMFMLVWGNCGSWLFSHPQQEGGMRSDVRRLAKRVLSVSVQDRFPTLPEYIQKLILNLLSFMCANTTVHRLYRFAFKCAWNLRDAIRRSKNAIRRRKVEI